MNHWFFQLSQRWWYCISLILLISTLTGIVLDPGGATVDQFFNQLLSMGAIGGGLSGCVVAWAWHRTTRLPWANVLSTCLLAGILIGGIEWAVVGAVFGRSHLDKGIVSLSVGVLLGTSNAAFTLWALHRVRPSRQVSSWFSNSRQSSSSPPARKPKWQSQQTQSPNAHKQTAKPAHKPGSTPVSSGSSPYSAVPPPTQGGTDKTAPDLVRQRFKLIKTLYALTPTEFDSVLFTLNPPRGIVPPLPAAQGERASALLQWLEGPTGPGLEDLRQILRDMGCH